MFYATFFSFSHNFAMYKDINMCSKCKFKLLFILYIYTYAHIYDGPIVQYNNIVVVVPYIINEKKIYHTKYKPA